jgi:low affinity Fe/Cu permease
MHDPEANGRDVFDRFADRCAKFVASRWFFSGCVALVILWTPTMFFMKFEVSQLLINTPTTIITFLLLALLHNEQSRFEKATNQRLEALTQEIASEDPVDDSGQKELNDTADEKKNS